MTYLTIEDIQIGDWVLYTPSTGDPIPVRIERLSGTTITCIYPCHCVCDISECSPLPLTDDMLLAGHALTADALSDGRTTSYDIYKDTLRFYSLSSRSHLYLKLTSNRYAREFGYAIEVGGEDIKITYVHELQRALRLVGLQIIATEFNPNL